MLAEIASPIIASVAVAIALLSWRASMRTSRFAQHYDHIITADRMLGSNKELLRFHGINPDEIEEVYGVTSTDLSYLLQAFNAGSISYILSNARRKNPFKKGSYWYNILKNDATQKAFPLIKQLFSSDNLYIAKCEETIRFIEKMNTNNTDGKDT